MGWQLFAAGIAMLPAIGLHAAGAGPSWTLQFPWPITGELVGVDFVDTTHGWVVGQGGLVASTADGGSTWSTQKVAASPEYYAVDFLDRNLGWIAGAAGAVLKTSDGGASWQLQNSGCRGSLWHVRFANPDTGWIFGDGCILFTGDGGLHWIDRDAENRTDWNRASFLDPDTAWAVGSKGRIIRTHNGFKTWEEQGLTNSTSFLSHVEFLDDRTGWVLGSEGIILRTTNGGAKWDTAVRSPNEAFHSGHFFTGDSGIVVGREGQVCTLSGGGTSFTCEQPFLSRSMHELIAGPGNRLWLVGSYSVFGSKPDGKGFRYLAGSMKTHIQDLAFTDADSGIATSETPGFVLRTTDGGLHWRPHRIPSDQTMESVFFLNSKTGWLCGGSPGGSAILKTSDGGVSWKRGDTGITARITRVRFADADRGWALTPEPVDQAFFTVDGGAHWSVSPNAELGEATDMLFPTPQSGWAIDRHGAIFHTTDGGKTWILQHSVAGEYLSALHFTSPDTGWAVGTGGTLLRYVGSAWKKVSGLGDRYFADIGFADQGRGWIAESDGRLLFTRDGGEHWTRDTTFPEARWTTLHVQDADHVWVGGDGIIKLGDPPPLGRVRKQVKPFPSGRSGVRMPMVGRERGGGAVYGAEGRKITPGERTFLWTIRPPENRAD